MLERETLLAGARSIKTQALDAAKLEILWTPPEEAPSPLHGAADLQRYLARLDVPETPVARVDGQVIVQGDVVEAINAIPAVNDGITFHDVYRAALILVEQRVALATRARAAGLDKVAVVARRSRNAADRAMADEIVRRSLESRLRDRELHAAYDALVAPKPGPEQVHVRIIATPTRDAADTALARLRGGVDFAELAREISHDASAAAGGDLGFAARGTLPAAVAAVAFSLGDGQTAAYPVLGVDTWFIVRVEGRRVAPTPDFDAARSGLISQILTAGAMKLAEDALKSVHVVYYGLTGKPGSGHPG